MGNSKFKAIKKGAGKENHQNQDTASLQYLTAGIFPNGWS
jgi:hypothetical protein